MLTRLTAATPGWWLLITYIFFGIGLGAVNPAITNSAVSGMPLEQAGVAGRHRLDLAPGRSGPRRRRCRHGR